MSWAICLSAETMNFQGEGHLEGLIHSESKIFGSNSFCMRNMRPLSGFLLVQKESSFYHVMYSVNGGDGG